MFRFVSQTRPVLTSFRISCWSNGGIINEKLLSLKCIIFHILVGSCRPTHDYDYDIWLWLWHIYISTVLWLYLLCRKYSVSSSVWEEKSNVMSHWLIDWTSGHWDVHLTRTATNPSFINYVNYDVGDHTDVDVFHETIGAIYLRIYAHNISSAYSIMCSKPLSFSVSWLWGMNISLTNHSSHSTSGA